MKFVRYFKENWKAILSCFIVSLGLSVYVQWSRDEIKVVHIRVEKIDLTNVPGREELILSSKMPAFMNVEFSGPRQSMNFNQSDFRVRLTNPRPVAGENIYRAELVPELPAGIEASYEKEISVYLDRVLVRALLVDMEASFEVPEGMKASPAIVTPSIVLVRGPYNTVAGLDRIKTVQTKIKVPGAIDRTTQKIALEELPEFVSLAPGQPFEVDAFVRVYPQDKWDESEILEGIHIRCTNERELELQEIAAKPLGKDKVEARFYTDGATISPEQFEARVYCPVFWDPYEKELKPRFQLSEVPVTVVDLLRRESVDLLEANPTKVSLQFERVPSRRPAEKQQGLKEHLIP